MDDAVNQEREADFEEKIRSLWKISGVSKCNYLELKKNLSYTNFGSLVGSQVHRSELNDSVILYMKGIHTEAYTVSTEKWKTHETLF